MLECALPPEENAEFYAVSDYPFNFEFIFGVIPPADAETVEGVINDIIGVVPEGKVPNWVVSTTFIHSAFVIVKNADKKELRTRKK